MLEELSEQQILAARTVLEYADIEPNDEIFAATFHGKS